VSASAPLLSPSRQPRPPQPLLLPVRFGGDGGDVALAVSSYGILSLAESKWGQTGSGPQLRFKLNSGRLFPMKRTLSILNLLVEKGLVEKYAIGGAMGATFYTEPFTTFDLDIFVLFPKADGPLVDISPIYGFLQKIGYSEFVGECIMIEGTPVQFLPTTHGLLDEALENARAIDYDGVPTWVLGPEYLLAIAIATGRPKDRARVPLFMASGTINETALDKILIRYNLLERWKSWTRD